MAEIRVREIGKVKLYENDNTSAISIEAPSSLTTDRTVTLPDADVTLAAGTMLATDGSGASLTALNATQITSGTIPDDARLPTVGVDKGGTNLTSYAAGDIVYASGTTAISKLAKPGTPAGEVLTFAACASAPSWASISTNDISWQSVQTSTPFTAVAGNGYPVNTTSGAITMNLPAGVVGEQVAVVDYAGTFDTNALTIAANGSEKIKGVTTDATMDTERQAGVLTYVDATQGWVITSAAPDPGLDQTKFVAATGGTITTCGNCKVHTFTGDGTFTVTCAGSAGGSNSVDYLIIAGGGGGGTSDGGSTRGGGGGGAGGFRFNYPNPATGGTSVAATPYAVTIGGGGAGAPGPAVAAAGKGGNSSVLSVTSTGGGRGLGHNCAGSSNKDGGSGGGGSWNVNAGGSGNDPPVSPPQGKDGGDGADNHPSHAGGGGGGHAACGANYGPNNTGGAGGNGSPSTINFSDVTRAGGGGGAGSSNPGAGGSGGGGAGSGGPGTGTAATPTTGSGGGSGNGPSAGGNGAGGIVIIRYKFQG